MSLLCQSSSPSLFLSSPASLQHLTFESPNDQEPIKNIFNRKENVKRLVSIMKLSS